MPIYEYKCSRCGEVCEVLQKVNDPAPKSCSACGGALKKLISSPAIQFKGNGWYITDYATKKSPPDNGQKPSQPQKKETAAKKKKEAGTETQPASKTG